MISAYVLGSNKSNVRYVERTQSAPAGAHFGRGGFYAEEISPDVSFHYLFNGIVYIIIQ